MGYPLPREVREAIEQMRRTVRGGTHYEVMGLERERFEPSQLPAAYRRMAKRWHADRFAQYDLGGASEALNEIFSAINVARRTLGDEASRLEYELELEQDEAGASSSSGVESLLRAESLFSRGKSMLRRGNYRAAAETFAEVAKLDPGDEAVKLHALYAEYRLLPKDERGEASGQARIRASTIEREFASRAERFEESDWFHFQSALIAQGVGRSREAIKGLRRALELNPAHLEAQRHKRLLTTRQRHRKDAEASAHSGLWSRLKSHITRSP